MVNTFDPIIFRATVRGKKNSLRRAESIVANLIAVFGDVPPDTTSARAWALQRITEVKPATFNQELGALKRVAPEAARDIPFRRVFKPSKDSPTDAEVWQIIQQLRDAKEDDAAILVEFLAASGLRIGEARALRWRHVRPDGILIEGDEQDGTKSGLSRTLPMFPAVRRVLAEIEQNNRFRGILQTPDLPVLSQRECYDQLKAITKFTHHSFRHHFATKAILRTRDVRLVAQWLGHQDNGKTLLDRYAHVLDDHSREMAEKMV